MKNLSVVSAAVWTAVIFIYAADERAGSRSFYDPARPNNVLRREGEVTEMFGAIVGDIVGSVYECLPALEEIYT